MTMNQFDNIESIESIESIAGAGEPIAAELDQAITATAAINDNSTPLADIAETRRLLEALIFASERPLSRADLQSFFPPEFDLAPLLNELKSEYENKGFQLVEIGGKWSFATASDLGPYLKREKTVQRKLTRATVETLAIIAYHQPVTRAEIEEIRGVSVAQGTLDILLHAGWIRPGRRRETPGRPVTWVSTDEFLQHFGISALEDLPGFEELKATGLLDKNRPQSAPLFQHADNVASAMAEAADNDSDTEEL